MMDDGNGTNLQAANILVKRLLTKDKLYIDDKICHEKLNMHTFFFHREDYRMRLTSGARGDYATTSTR